MGTSTRRDVADVDNGGRHNGGLLGRAAHVDAHKRRRFVRVRWEYVWTVGRWDYGREMATCQGEYRVRRLLPTQNIYANYCSAHRITRIACGHYHSVAITSTGAALTWGWSVHGQLGHGTRALHDHLVPDVVRGMQDKVAHIGAGQCHTVFVTEGGAVYACGSAQYGQLGMGRKHKTKCALPRRVTLLCHEEIVCLGVGQFHNMAWTATGHLYTWGSTPRALKLRAMVAKRAKKAAEENSPATPLNGLSPTSAVEKIVADGGITADTDTSHMIPLRVDLPQRLEDGA